jgi:hypothetical protein
MAGGIFRRGWRPPPKRRYTAGAAAAAPAAGWRQVHRPPALFARRWRLYFRRVPARGQRITPPKPRLRPYLLINS